MTKTRLGGSGTPLPDDGYGRDRLPYPFSYAVELTQDYNIDIIEPDEPGIADDICNLYVLALTPQQELWFVSALQAGADLIYPTFWQDIMNIWENARLRVNTFDFVSCGEGEDIPTFCERVIACLEDQPPGDQPGLDDFIDIEAQQKEIVCGSIEFAVEEIMQQGEVVLDFVEAAASVANALADILQHYGRFGAVPTAVQGAISGIVSAVAAARSEWQAQSTEDLIRCGLYCAVIANGGPPYTLSEAVLRDGYDIALADLGPLTLKGQVLRATWYFIPKRVLASRFQIGIDQALSSTLCDALCEPCVDDWRVDWQGSQLSNLTVTDGVYDGRGPWIGARHVQGANGDWATRALVTWNPGNAITFVGAGMGGVLNKGLWNGGTDNMLSVDVPGYQHRFLEQNGVAFFGPGPYSYDEPSLTSRSASQVEWTIRAARDDNQIPTGLDRGNGTITSLTVYGTGPVPANLAGGTLTML